ncbi:MAG: DNA polymerase I [Desulfobacteraceae bacterium]|uniref:DNA polymerase I n=1 Tax=Candidatus Desulfaltia bathyphila TaxID=2841697 RepID=A0A8J6N767_9BACT|nr:DNA polymerase I [Candidatus Desulfaltia bathyphila]MBL7195647.1 DNA polymerase I [Desulfobacterales bacterium]
MNKEKTLYLIDGSAYIYRAYHAIQSLTNSKGLPTNAAFGFTRTLLKLIEERAPEYLAMFFDAKGPTFRHKIYKEYKANRPPMPDDLSIQIPYIKDITKGFNMPVIEMPGYEADDLIGTLSTVAEKAGFHVVMVTGDKDFMQLVTDKITIWDPMKDKIIDAEAIQKTFGVEPLQIIDIMGLTGDTADNIPGVPGVGPKTAINLIKTYQSMELLYERIDTVKKKKLHENLVKYKDQAFLSRELVTINTSLPLSFNPEELKAKTPDNNILSRLFKDLEFRQLQQAFPRKSDLSKKNYKTVFSIDEISDLVNNLERAGLFALDTETTSVNPMQAKLVGLSFSSRPDQAFYIPCGHDYPGVPDQPGLDEVLNLLKPVLENPDIKKIGQNIKYDWIVLARHGINLSGIVFDTMLASYLLNPSKRAHNLDQIALDFLDHRTITYSEVTGGKGKKGLCFSHVLIEKAGPYACEDADITLMAYDALKPMLKEARLEELFEKVEMPLVPVLMKMEMTGICIDREKLRSLSKSFEHQLEGLEGRIFAIAGEEFNINSSQQLGRILFEKLDLPVQKKTKKKTGYSTDVDVLTTLAAQHELPAIILRYRSLSKLKSTYTDALLELIHPETGRIHTSFNQTVTATGRLSSSDPNLQNIPVRTDDGREIRKAFIPKKGWSILSADYSQIELRILAHYSNDQILIKAFQDDEDIHTRTAAEVFQVFPSFITPELRQQAKVINFGIVYGMSAYGLSKELGISRKMATTYIENYFARYKGVKEFIDRTIEDAKQTKKTSTLLGRIRLLPDINSSNRNVREFAERTAINTPIQGSAADLIKVAMINVDMALKGKGLKTAMLLSVHDEIVFESPPDEIDLVQELVKNIMEGVWDLKVPLKVNVACGVNWAEAH